jgi:hypothetical protein
MNQVTRSAAFEIPQAIDTLFPLFSPEGEKLWVPDWGYENIMGSTELHEDDVFLTKTHDHASTDAIWLVKRYEPTNHRVQFYKVEPGDKVGIVTVQCFKIAEKQTRVQVTYTYIALTVKGKAFIHGFTDEAYQAFIDEWKMLLNRYYLLK